MPKTISISAIDDIWDEVNERFIPGIPAKEIVLEHSLLSISKWEEIWEIPYLSDEPKTPQQMVSYLQCMCVNEEDQNYINYLTKENVEDINAYINKKMTATWFKEDDQKKPRNKRIVTAELIYAWMAMAQIPFECEKWHFNKLMTLLRVYSEENKQPEKMPKNEMIKNRRALNAARRAKTHSRG